MLTAPLSIRLAESRRDLARFVDAPWRIYDRGAHPHWVPPLRAAVRANLDRRRNPFYRNADRALFLARRGDRVVGRIAAIENRAHNMFHHDRVGFYGFFECLDDREAAEGLFAAAAAWLKDRGLEAMRGPTSPSMNHECGLLVDGFDLDPMFMCPWNPPYYERLHVDAGLAACKDLVGFRFPLDLARNPLPERFRKQAERMIRRKGLSFRKFDPRRYWDEVEVAWRIYNSAWEDNWGFVPMTHEEFRHQARDLRRLVVPDFLFVAEIDGEPAGVCLVLPDYNPVLKRIGNGRLFPTGLVHILRAKRRIRSGRVFLMGVVRKYRHQGLTALLMYEAYRRGIEYGGQTVEASWMLEDNEAMLSPLRAAGAEQRIRWRLFEQAVS